MTRDEITRMAREAGFEELGGFSDDWVCFGHELERFFLAAYAAGAAAERNAILQMSRDQWFKTQADFEEAIRARESTNDL